MRVWGGEGGEGDWRGYLGVCVSISVLKNIN